MVKWIEFNTSGLLMIEEMNFSMLQAEVSGHACPRLIRVHVRGFLKGNR